MIYIDIIPSSKNIHNQIIGEKIRQERTYKKLSQKQLAEKVGMSEPAIRNYELGNKTPSQRLIELIASALEVSPFTLSDPDLDTLIPIHNK